MDYSANSSNSSNEASQLLNNFWPRITKEVQNMTPNDFKNVELPLARIKKIMKLDDEVKMISAEAPIIFAKAAEIFIQELTIRAWIHTEENKRRTLQRNDTALAISKFDQFDFLIDIVPREEIKPSKKEVSNAQSQSVQQQQTSTILNTSGNNTLQTGGATAIATDANGNIQYYVLPSNGIQNGIPLQLGQLGTQIIQLAAPNGQASMNGQPTIISLVGNAEQ